MLQRLVRSRFLQCICYAMWAYEAGNHRSYGVFCLDCGSIHAIRWPMLVTQVNVRIVETMGVAAVAYTDDTVPLLVGDTV